MRPDHFESILGSGFVRRSADLVLQFSGGKSYDRFQLAAIGIPQLKAARYLHVICSRLSIASPAQLAARLEELPRIKGIGHAAFYAALAILAAEGYENRAVENYTTAAVALSKHPGSPGEKDWTPTPVKFGTLKRRDPQKPKRKRKS